MWRSFLSACLGPLNRWTDFLKIQRGGISLKVFREFRFLSLLTDNKAWCT
jgi:hypothetical protein